MPEKTKKQLEKHLEQKESDEARVLGFYQRMNLAGVDYKGQLSSAYTQTGIGMSASGKIDFGAMLVPFVHLPVSATLSGSGAAHGLLVLTRMPQMIWRRGQMEPGQPAKLDRKAPIPPLDPADWTSRRPLAMAHLRGKTWELKGAAAASAWGGLGENFVSDEMGVSGGLKLEGAVIGRSTRLVDAEVVHSGPSAYDSGLAGYVDDLLVQNLRKRVARWLIRIAGGEKDARDLEAPATGFRARLRRYKAYGGKAVEGAETVAAWFDDTVIPDVQNAPVVSTGKSIVRAVTNLGRKIKNRIKSSKLPEVDELEKDVQAVKEAFEDWVKVLEGGASPEERPHTETIANFLAVAKLRIAEADELLGALRRTKPPDPNNNDRLQPTPGQNKNDPLCHLNLATMECWAKASAGMKMVAPTQIFKLKAALLKRVGSKRVSLRYQNFVPGRDLDGDEKTLVTTQDTLINYNLQLFDAELTAQSRKNRLAKENPKHDKFRGVSDKRHVTSWTAMTYHSVFVQWFHEPGPGSPMAMPNGSGISFGLSILTRRVRDYARACRKLGKMPAGAKLPDLPSAQLTELEGILTKQLRVTARELRGFMRRAPQWLGDDLSEKHADDNKIKDFDEMVLSRETSLILESSFALVRPEWLRLKNGQPQDLFKINPLADVMNGKQRDDARIHLQAIRLRYRIESEDDKSRSLISLGWNPEPWAEDDKGERLGISPPFVKKSKKENEEDKRSWWTKITGIDPKLPNWLKTKALAVQVGLSVERVERVGAEGVIDLFVRNYPNPYSTQDPPRGYGPERSKALENKALHQIREISVPPVALFSQ
ncbi:MAG: hypothetical protein AAF557_22570 [Pseudomonadota bacterium]